MSLQEFLNLSPSHQYLRIIVIGAFIAVVIAAISRVRASYKSNLPHLPPSIAFLRWIAILYLAIFKRFSARDADRLPVAGPVIVVSNHVKAYDPVCIQVASPHRLIRFLQAREYYEQRPVYYLLRLLQVIPLNRTGNDTTGIRTALRALSKNECLGIFPEGKISEDGNLNEAHAGVALLALASNAVVIPAYIHGATPHAGILSDYLQFSRVKLQFGRPVPLDDLYGRHRDEAARELAVQRIMAAIVALRDQNDAPSTLVTGEA